MSQSRPKWDEITQIPSHRKKLPSLLLGLIPAVESFLLILGEHTFWGSFLEVEPLLPFLGEHTFWGPFLEVEPMLPFLGEHTFQGSFLEVEHLLPLLEGANFLGPISQVEFLLPIIKGAYFMRPQSQGGTLGQNPCSLFLGEHIFQGPNPRSGTLGQNPCSLREHTFQGPFLEVKPLHPILGGAYFLRPQSCGRISTPHSQGSTLFRAHSQRWNIYSPFFVEQIFWGPYPGQNLCCLFLGEHILW